MKKRLALLLALVMVLGSFSFVSAAPALSDVAGTEYEDAVARLEALNVLKGYPDGTFKPENTITRAEFAAVAVRAKGLEKVAEAAVGLPSGFTDVPAGHWAAGYVGVAGSTGVVNGIGGGLFAPNAPVKYEEAITMIVRALGYEAAAQTKGGYPYGYLIVAKEVGLLDDVLGTMGAPATRGMVAQLTDNALEIPMMIQVEFGTGTKWVVSGAEEDGPAAVWLLDFMGYTSREGRVVDFDDEDLTIELEGDYDGELNVPEGFKFFSTYMVTIKAWTDGKDVVAYTMLDTVKYDAVKADGEKLQLVTEGKSYAYHDYYEYDDYEVLPANFAKVVFDGSKVVAVVSYDLEGFIVADKVDDEMIIDLNKDELDLIDLTILKDGAVISPDDIEKGDVVFYDLENGIAVVFNNTVSGSIQRVYEDLEFRVGGKTYSADGEFYAVYVDGKTLAELTVGTLDSMMDEKEDVKVFFDFNKKVVLVTGVTGDPVLSEFYAVLTANSREWADKYGDFVSLNVLTQEGEKAAYEIESDFADVDVVGITNVDKDKWLTKAKAGVLVLLTVDEDGDVTEVNFVGQTPVAVENDDDDDFDVDDKYIGSDRLMASTIVFYDYKDSIATNGPRKVIAFGDIDDEFFEILVADVYADNGRVEVLLAIETDAKDVETTAVEGVLTKIRKLSSGYLEFTLKVGKTEKVYLSETKDGTVAGQPDIDSLVKVKVIDGTEKLQDLGTKEYAQALDVTSMGEVTEVNTAAKTIDVYGVVYYLLDGAVVYDEDMDVAALRDVKVGYNVDFVLEELGSRFVKYVIFYENK